jgi:signal transduction histidine kinase/CheY-like chemotaxis protein
MTPKNPDHSAAPPSEEEGPPDAQSWLEATEGGEMGERIRGFDWSTTGLGPLAAWPEVLRVSLRLCLNSRFPMNIWWGPDLINFYNDAFVPILGRRHPDSLGQPARTVWPDAWPTISAQVEKVVERAESTWNERVHFVLTRNGFPEEAWFTWSYSPIRGEGGSILGLHGICMEDTARVLAEKSRERLADEQLRQGAEARARSILESITEAFFSLDQEWRFTSLKPQSFVLLGRPPEQLVGKSLWEEYPGLYGSPFEAIYRGVAATRKTASIVAYFPDHQRWYDVRAYPAEDGGLSVYFRDVSQQKLADEEKVRLLESERLARTEAERAGRLKDEFLATLSHELRTPLNAVLGWCDILNRADKTSPTDMAEGLNTIERNARAQAQIIADILDMSSIIAGKMRVVFRPLNLAAIVHEAIETARPAAQAKGVLLRAALDTSLDRILADGSRLQQVFWNLLSNAVKFTPKGGTVQVALERIDSHIEVSVSDTGVGIKPDFLPFVFDRFRQADASITRQYGGLGLGLSIVKQLIELHGGTIAVESQGVGLGSRFVVSLPLNAIRSVGELDPERSNGKSGIAEPLLPEGGIAGVRVLIVDDEPDARAMVKRLLEDYGAIVTAASSAHEGVERLQAEKPDVLVSDIGMPGEDGYSMMRRIRSLRPEQGGETPSLALTAYARIEDRDRSILAGFQMHLPKPVEPTELVVMVAALGRKTEASGDGSEEAIISPLAKMPPAPKRILLVEDHEETRNVIKKLLDRRRHLVTPVSSVSEARDVAEREQFDLVISDLGLPDGSGNSLMAELHSRFGLNGIALSGYGDAAALSQSREAGFVVHLTKPVSITALEEALLAAGKRRQQS